MGPAAVRPPPRKRVRKRKRRAVSSSSSSSSSSESDSDQEKPSPKSQKPVISQKTPEPSSSSEASSSSSSESDSEPEDAVTNAQNIIHSTKTDEPSKSRQIARRTSPSPSPPPPKIPSFINAADPEKKESEEQLMKAKFRKFWMSSVVDGFKDDLEQIRKEPNLGQSRLSLLIDSLASGADVFSSSRTTHGVNEMEVVLE